MIVQRRQNHAGLLLNVLQLGIDTLACFCGFVLGFNLYKHTSVLEGFIRQHHVPVFEDYYFAAGGFAIMVILSFTVKHLYQSRETGLMNMDEATSVLQGLFLATAVIVFASYFLPNPNTTRISRLILGLSVIIGCVLVLAGRALGF